MARRNRHKQASAPAGMGKKAQEREARIQAARQRDRLPKFVALASILVDKWRRNEALQDDIASLPANERRYYKMQLAKIDRAICRVVPMLFKEAPKPSSPMMRDASDLLLYLLQAVCTAKTMPETCMHKDVHAVMTYIVYVALQESQWNTDTPEEVRHLITCLGAFCNHAIPADSPLIPALNEVFCLTRNRLHSGAELPHYKGVPEVEVA